MLPNELIWTWKDYRPQESEIGWKRGNEWTLVDARVGIIKGLQVYLKKKKEYIEHFVNNLFKKVKPIKMYKIYKKIYY